MPPDRLLHWQPRTPADFAQAGSLIVPARAATSSAMPAPTRSPLVATSPNPSWQEWGGPVRVGQELVLDSRRHRMMLLGGFSQFDPQGSVWSCSLPAAEWQRLATVPWNFDGASREFAIAAVYDSLRDRLLVLHADGNFELDALSLDGTSVWAHLWTGPVTSNGALAALALDTRRDAVDLIGVWDAVAAAHRMIRVPLADPAAWTSQVTSGAQPLIATTGDAVYDASRDQFEVLLRSGRFNAQFSTLTAADPPTWGQLAQAPSPHYVPFALALDAAHDQLIVTDQGQEVLGVPLVAGPTQMLLVEPPPSSNYQAASLFDPSTRRLYVNGGAQNSDGEGTLAGPLTVSATVDSGVEWFANQAPQPGAAAWLCAGAPGLSSRIWHSMLVDSPGQQAVVYGGYQVSGPLPQVLARPLSGATDWAPLGVGSDSLPRVRFMQSVALDPGQHALVLYGGQATDGTGDLLGDLWVLPLGPGGTWQRVVVPGTGPGPRRNAALAYDAGHSRFVLIGGDDLHVGLGDAWELRFGATPAWRQLTLSGPAPAYQGLFVDSQRGDAWSVHYGSDPVEHVVFGDDVVTFETVTTVGPVPTYVPAVAGFDPDSRRLLWIGGDSNGSNTNLGASWTTNLGTTVSWNAAAAQGGVPSSRYLMATAFDASSSRLILSGGYFDTGYYLSDTWSMTFPPAIPTASLVSLVDAAVNGRSFVLRWDVGLPMGTACMVEHSRDATEWTTSGLAEWTTSNEIRFVGALPDAGSRVAYRVRVSAPGGDAFSSVTWVDGPAAAFAIAPTANPSRGAPSLRLSLLAGSPARLRLLDVGGRVISETTVPAETRTWTPAGASRPGMYFAEIEQSGQRRVTRVVVTP